MLTFSPLGIIFFQKIYGLTYDLVFFSLPSLQIMILMPILSLVLCWQKSVLIYKKQTKIISYASLCEIISLMVSLFLLINYFRLNGVLSVVLALLIGRFLSVSYLVVEEYRFNKVEYIKRVESKAIE